MPNARSDDTTLTAKTEYFIGFTDWGKNFF